MKKQKTHTIDAQQLKQAFLKAAELIGKRKRRLGVGEAFELVLEANKK